MTNDSESPPSGATDNAISAAIDTAETAPVTEVAAEAPATVEATVEAAAVPAEPAVPAPPSFDDLGLHPDVKLALDEMGYFTPTSVQAAVYKPVSEGKDLLVQSRTGTGKTTAFGLPTISKIIPTHRAPQAMILAPTRELALQVSRELTNLAKHRGIVVEAIYGGAPIGKQITALRDGVHIVVGTPGRVLDHIGRRTLDCSAIQTFILDECDEMLSMGFLEDIERVVQHLPTKKQTLLFSATMPDEVTRYARRHMTAPEQISLSRDGATVSDIHHAYYIVSGIARSRDLLKIIFAEEPDSAIIFCNTRDETTMVAKFLQKQGLDAEPLSSDLSQNDRERVMGRMKQHNLRFLCATDVAARGIDISDLSHVINYSVPESPEVYVHRTGRTGRAGKKGTALSMVGPRELGNFRYVRLQFNLKPEERLLPKDSIFEGKLKVPLPPVGLPQPPDPVQVILRGTPLTGTGPSDLEMKIFEKLLSSSSGKRVIAQLVAERLNQLSTRSKPRPARVERTEHHHHEAAGPAAPAGHDAGGERGGERPSFRDGGGDRERRPFRDRDGGGDRGDRPSFRDRDGGGERRPFRDRDAGPGPGADGGGGERGDRPSFRDRDGGGERRPFRDRDGGGERGERGDRPSFRDRDRDRDAGAAAPAAGAAPAAAPGAEGGERGERPSFRDGGGGGGGDRGGERRNYRDRFDRDRDRGRDRGDRPERGDRNDRGDRPERSEVTAEAAAPLATEAPASPLTENTTLAIGEAAPSVESRPEQRTEPRTEQRPEPRNDRGDRDRGGDRGERRFDRDRGDRGGRDRGERRFDRDRDRDRPRHDRPQVAAEGTDQTDRTNAVETPPAPAVDTAPAAVEVGTEAGPTVESIDASPSRVDDVARAVIERAEHRDRGDRGDRKPKRDRKPEPTAETREFWETWAEEKTTRVAEAPAPTAAPAAAAASDEPAASEAEAAPAGGGRRGRDRDRGRGDRGRSREAKPEREAKPVEKPEREAKPAEKPEREAKPAEKPEREAKPERASRGKRDTVVEPARAAAATTATATATGESGQARLFISLGKKHGVSADDLRSLLSGPIGGDKARIGSVSLRDSHAHVRVPEDVADAIITGLHGTQHNEHDVTVERARA